MGGIVMLIATRKMTYQISEYEFETVTESKVFQDNASISELKDWFEYGNKSFHIYASPAIQVQFVEE